MNSKIININSKDCTKIDDNTNQIVNNINEPIVAREDEIITIEVIDCVIPFSCYNVNYLNKYLNVFEAKLNGSHSATFTIEMPVGNYNVLQFASTLQTILNTNSPGNHTYTITYDKFTNKFTFTVGNNCQAIFLFKTGTDSYRDMQLLLGFYKKEDYYFDHNNPLISDSTANMSPIDSYYIHSNFLLANTYSSKSKNITDLLIKLPINVQPFAFVIYKPYTTLEYIINQNVVNYIYLSVRDSDGDLVNLNNNDWNISLKFTIRKKNDYWDLNTNVRQNDKIQSWVMPY